MIFRKSLTVLLVILLSGLCVLSVAQRRREAGLPKYYKEWLEKDVVYIITEEERRLFRDLRNDEERESFIQQFWDRRNPDPRSSYNAFKEEHYRRIAYTNEHFASGVPGWRTDRGRVYITWGPPDDRETYATGGIYYRTLREGGGSTSRHPWEKWWYRHIDGVGHGVELLFGDTSNSNEYRLVMYEDELDALLHVEGMGLTLAEEMGLADKRDRAYFNPSGWYDPDNPQSPGSRVKDAPFTRMEQYFNVQRPPKIKFEDLKSVVTTNVTYSAIPFDIRTDYVRLSEDKVLVPITIEISNAEL
ncbi:MAG: GWxTD domain-containing protein, partial [Acidobacteriota bacterium]|nr:GWxTD domain-containing protein [Acidobacteriota bacterium]